MQEIDAISYDLRTEKNVTDSDGTLLFSSGTLKGGSLLTRKLVRKHFKLCLHIGIEKKIIVRRLRLSGHGSMSGR